MTDNYPVIDGFLLSTSLRANLTFFSLAVREYEALRRSGNLRCRAWTVPNDPATIAIPAVDAYEFQIYAEPGSAIWGYSFVAPTGQFSFQVTDSCTDVPLLSEPVFSTGQNQEQQLLSKLLVISKPGLLNVQIMSLVTSNTLGIQLILWGGEPVPGASLC